MHAQFEEKKSQTLKQSIANDLNDANKQFVCVVVNTVCTLQTVIYDASEISNGMWWGDTCIYNFITLIIS